MLNKWPGWEYHVFTDSFIYSMFMQVSDYLQREYILYVLG